MSSNIAYPSQTDLDSWCVDLITNAQQQALCVTVADTAPINTAPAARHQQNSSYLAFTKSDDKTFYGYWQPSYSPGPAPLLIHLPGYGAEMCAHPELVTAGYNVLHINPLGYATPLGFDIGKQRNNNWPVLPDTVTSKGESGYRDWLTDALLAIFWACEQPMVQKSRLAIFGTSQGGGTALLLASLLGAEKVRAVAADLPFLTGFPMHTAKKNRGAYEMAYQSLEAMPDEEQPAAWNALGFIDTLSHAHRLTMPTLLTAGDIDNVCPSDSITALFDLLPGTRSYTVIQGQDHAYTTPFLTLAKAWFGLFV